MNRRFLLAIAGALFFGLLAIIAAQSILKDQVNKKIAESETPVIVATTEIPLGTKIGEQHIALVKFPKKHVPEGAMVKKEEVLDRVAYTNISPKTVILGNQLAGVGSQPGLPGVTALGMRSVSVRVDEASGVAGFIAPGTYVDVIAIIQPQLEGAKPVSKVILQKIKVLAGGQQMQTKADGKAQQVNTVTLEVTPAQAEKLKLAEAEGRLQLSIRNATDQITEKTPGATKRDVLNDIALENRAREGTRDGFGGGPARPSQAPPPFNINVNNPNPPPTAAPAVKSISREKSIEVIEGAKRTRVEVVP